MTRANNQTRHPPVYLAHVVPGLESFVKHDLREHVDDVRVLETLSRFDDRTSLLTFTCGEPPAQLLRLRSVEDIFVLVASVTDLQFGRRGLRQLEDLVQSRKGWDSPVTAAQSVRRRRRGKPTFRVVVRQAGEHGFRRLDAQRATTAALVRRFPGWKQSEDDATFEVWVHIVRDHVWLAIRLSDITMRQHRPRQADLTAALKPTIAYAMASLSQPEPGDVVLDPMCGTGSILIERAETERYRQLLGGDIDPTAVRAARKNIGPKYKPIEIREWDACALPLLDEAVSTVICNLPFGRKVGSPAQVKKLYPGVVSEIARVVRPRGKIVLLTSAAAELAAALRSHRHMKKEQEVGVQVRGHWATIFVLRKS